MPSPNDQAYDTLPAQFAGVAVAANVTDCPTVVLAGTEAVVVRAQGWALTSTDTLARFESMDPSQAANVKRSLPAKPGNGKYVAVRPVRLTVPLIGWDTMRNVNALPSGSLA